MNTFIGKYEIIEELGRGGFGIVYKVRDTVLEVERALKVLHPVLVADTTFLARFKQEAQLAAKLEAPNLVPVYDFGEDDGRFYLVMKYMPGGSLKDLLAKNGRLDEQQALEIFEEAGRGVDYAHSHGVIHRDLKPSNILFDSDNTVRISDMGFAKFLSGDSSTSMSTTGGMVGTPAYMAPEIWRGKPATAASDIYSMGCILYEMLTGAVLFDGDSPADVMTKHVLDGPMVDEGFPEQFIVALEKSLAKNPFERYQSMTEFITELRQLEEEHKQPEKIKMVETQRIVQVVEEGTNFIDQRELKSHKIPNVKTEKQTSFLEKPLSKSFRIILISVVGIIGLLILVVIISTRGFIAFGTTKVPASTAIQKTILVPTIKNNSDLTITSQTKLISTQTIVSRVVNYIQFTERTNPETPSSNLMIVYTDGTKEIIAINSEDAQISKECKYIVFSQYYDSNNDKAITFDDNSSMSIYDINKKILIRVSPKGDEWGFPTFSPDGTRLAFTKNKEVWVMNIDSGEIHQITTNANWAGHLKWSPDGNYLAFYSSDGNGSYLTVVNPDGTSYRRLSNDVGNGWGFQWTNNNSIIFAMNSASESYFIDPNSGNLEKITKYTYKTENRMTCGWPLSEGVSRP